MKTDVHFWSYLAQFFLEWEMFQTKAVEKIKTHILGSVIFFLFGKWCLLWQNVVTGQATNDNVMRRLRIACWCYGTCREAWEKEDEFSTFTPNTTN